MRMQVTDDYMQKFLMAIFGLFLLFSAVSHGAELQPFAIAKDGSMLKGNWWAAVDYCRNHKAHLATARELADFAAQMTGDMQVRETQFKSTNINHSSFSSYAYGISGAPKNEFEGARFENDSMKAQGFDDKVTFTSFDPITSDMRIDFYYRAVPSSAALSALFQDQTVWVMDRDMNVQGTVFDAASGLFVQTHVVAKNAFRCAK
jgi:hypothetical protein